MTPILEPFFQHLEWKISFMGYFLLKDNLIPMGVLWEEVLKTIRMLLYTLYALEKF